MTAGPHTLYVVKRNGKTQPCCFDKITKRVAALCMDLNKEYVDPSLIAQKVVQGIYPGVTTKQLDTLAAETAASMATTHPDYGLLAGRILVSDNMKSTPDSIQDCAAILEHFLSVDYINFVEKNWCELDVAIDHSLSYDYDFFAAKTFIQKYLLKDRTGAVAENIQFLYMRVAFTVTPVSDDSVLHLKNVLETYKLLATKKYIHGSPTLFNASTECGQLASCFLLDIADDSLVGIYKTLSDSAIISKNAGGLGIAVHKIRSKGSKIKGTGGISDGIVPMLRVFNSSIRYANQSGRRPGACAIYLEPHHADIMDFLELRLPHGQEESRCRDLFTALWVSDLFFERLENKEQWSLFDPSTAPGLDEVYGDEYKSLYERYENEGRAIKVVSTMEIFAAIYKSLVETGTPYILSKDSVNGKNDQRHLGTIKSSNLCGKSNLPAFNSSDSVFVVWIQILQTGFG